jgi:DNA polymerase-3 subunit epsilon
LAEVYLDLIGARQAQLVLVEMGADTIGAPIGPVVVQVRPVALVPRLSAEECDAHLAFIATLGETAVWREYLQVPAGGA